MAKKDSLESQTDSVQEKSSLLRKEILSYCAKYGGHLGSALSASVLFPVLYSVTEKEDQIFLCGSCRELYLSLDQVLPRDHTEICSPAYAFGKALQRDRKNADGRIFLCLETKDLSLENRKILDRISEYDKQLILIVSEYIDSSRHASLIKKGISALGNTAAYGTLKTGVKKSLSPLKHGDEIIQSIHETKSAVKKAVWNEGVFRELNMDYYGPFAGNDSEKIALALDQALLQNHPVLLHFLCEERTLPAKYKELLRSSYTEPFDLQTGKKKLEETDTFRRSSSFAIEAIAQVLKKDPSVCFYSDRSSDRFLSLSAAVPKQYLSYDLSKKDLLELSIGSAAENDGIILSMDETEFLSLTDLLDTLSDQIRGRFLLCVSCKENSDLSHATVLKNYDVFLAKDSAEIADRIIRFAEQRKPQILIYPEMYLYAQEQNTIDQNDRGICPVYVNNDMRGTALITDGTDTDRIRKRITENSMNLDLYRICYLSPFDEKGLLEILNSYSRVFVYHSCIERRIRDLFNRYCSGTVVQYLGKDETDLLAEDQRK